MPIDPVASPTTSFMLVSSTAAPTELSATRFFSRSATAGVVDGGGHGRGGCKHGPSRAGRTFPRPDGTCSPASSTTTDDRWCLARVRTELHLRLAPEAAGVGSLLAIPRPEQAHRSKVPHVTLAFWVVEAPRDSKLKLKYDPELGAVTWGHPLPIGFAYPYDWGFVPSTLAPDGDPLDALVLSEVGSHPGVVIPCRPFGVLELEEKMDGRRARNDRLVVMPLQGRWTNEVDKPADMPRETIEELEHFFLSTVFFTHKNARCLGWKGPKAAERLIEAAVARAEKAKAA